MARSAAGREWPNVEEKTVEPRVAMAGTSFGWAGRRRIGGFGEGDVVAGILRDADVWCTIVRVKIGRLLMRT